VQTYALLGTANHMISIGVAITPSRLRLDPIWDPIRNDPRFQELVAEKKP